MPWVLRVLGVLRVRPERLLKTVLGLDALEAAAFVKRMRAIARDARSHPDHLTSALGGPGLGGTDQRAANSTTPLSFGDDETENLR